MRFHVYHHYPEMNEQLSDIIGLLVPMAKDIDMLSKEVQDLMVQAEKNVSLTASLDAGFKALTSQVALLQQQINDLQGNGVITDAEKQQLVNTTNDLAAAFSTLQADIPANTEAAPAPVEAAPESPDDGKSADEKPAGDSGAQ